MKAFFEWLYAHYFFTMLLVLWLMGLLTVATLFTFVWTANVPAGTAAALGTVFGIVGLTIGLWQWARSRGGKDKGGRGADD